MCFHRKNRLIFTLLSWLSNSQTLKRKRLYFGDTHTFFVMVDEGFWEDFGAHQSWYFYVGQQSASSF